MDEFKPKNGYTKVFNWMGWLYTVVGCFIVALLVLMFLDLSTKTNIDRLPPEATPAVQIASPAIANPTH